jgi:hypothetical protein
MALSSESPKIKGVRKEFPPRDNSKVGKLGKENRHRRTHSCIEKLGGGGGGLVRPLAERQPNSSSSSDRNFLYVDRRYKVVKCEDGASPDHLSDTNIIRSAAPSDGRSENLGFWFMQF